MGGRSSAGGNKVSANAKSVASKATTQKSTENSSSAATKSWQDLDKEPIGSAYMSPAGTVYVKQDNEKAVYSSWASFFPNGGGGYAKNAEGMAELLKKGGFTKLPSNSTYYGAGSYTPTPEVLARGKELRKAYNAEQKRREAEKKQRLQQRRKEGDTNGR